MAIVFHPGQVLTQNDLKITIRDSGSALVDPYYIRYSLFDYTTGVEVLIGIADRVPATTGVGNFYVDAMLPLDSNIGDWIVRWNFRETVSAPLIQVAQEFAVVKSEVITSITGDPAQDDFIRRLRILLRDNNPDRNYRFRAPSSERFLQAQAQVFGYIWEDYELIEYCIMAVDDLNSAPPVTGATLDDLPTRWRTAVLIKAAAHACMAISMNWIADEFSVAPGERVTVRCENNEEFSLTFEELFDIVYGDMMKEVERRVKEEFKESMEGLSNAGMQWFRFLARLGVLFAKRTGLKIYIACRGMIKRLQQVRRQANIDKIKNAFSNGTLLVRSMKNKEDKPSWNAVSDITKHHTPYKKIYRVFTEIGSVEVTEDHSLFDGKSKDPVKVSDLKQGDFVIGLPRSEFEPIEIISIEEMKPLEDTYDLTVPDAENAVLDSGILVHNTYSISGVSLDIDKSSKYQSMKQNFEQEYDKAKDGIKRSIKVVKGLKQPRYSVGISSALGPYSKPGVQSRRNFCSGFRGGWS